MIATKPYKKWSSEDKKKFGKDIISYAKEAGLPLKRKLQKKK
jgi:hypothetical protein